VTAPKAKRPRKPIYLTCKRLVDPASGEEVRAWVASTQWDAASMKARGYKVGTQVRAEFKRPRNPKFHALAHAIGALAVEHIEGYEEMETHAALKKLQRACGVCCEEIDIDLGPALGIVKAKQAQSIAFDEMDETSFSELVHGVCAYIRETFHGVPPGELSEIIATVEEGHA
jgi:hypothetical protein